MNKIFSLLICIFLVVVCSAQDSLLKAKAEKKAVRAREKNEERYNYFANRKYAISISEGAYFNVDNTSQINSFGIFELMFSDRIKPLDFAKNASLVTMFGIGFEPYQGTKLSIGSHYNLLSKKIRLNANLGFQYSVGLPQSSSFNGNSFITLGVHHYLMPYVGFTWWICKTKFRYAMTDLQKKQYEDPTFWQLFFIKFQVGYSYLLNKLSIDTTAGFDKQLYQIVRDNSSNTLNFKLGVGINIPSHAYRAKYKGIY